MGSIKNYLVLKYKSANWAIADQAMVSGTNFLTGVLIAKYLGLEEFGRFSLIWMVITLFSGIQHALITAPMLSVAPKYLKKTSQFYWGAVLIQQFLWVVVSSIFLFSVMLLVNFVVPNWELQDLILPVTLTLIAFQVQDFFRRYFFALSKPHLAFLNDVISYIGQIAVLLILFFNSVPKTQYVLWVITITSILASMVAFFNVNRFKVSSKFTRNIVWQHWKLSKWLLGSVLLQWTSGMNFFLMVSGYILGPIAVGALRSAQNIVGLINIIFMAMENFVPSKASSVFSSGGKEALVEYLKHVAISGTVITVFIALVFGVFSDFWMELLYGSEFAKYAFLVQWLGLIYVLVFPTLPLGAGLKALEKTRSIFMSQFWMSSFSIVTAFPLLNVFGLYGYVIGVICVRVGILWILILDFKRRIQDC